MPTKKNSSTIYGTYISRSEFSCKIQHSVINPVDELTKPCSFSSIKSDSFFDIKDTSKRDKVNLA